MVNPRAAVGRGRSLVEHEGRAVAHRVLRAREQPLVLPGREQLLLERVRRELRVERRVGHQFKRASDDLLDRRGRERVGEALVRDDRHAQRPHPHVHRRDHLGHRAHPHDVRTQPAQHAVLCARLQTGTGDGDVHALPQQDPLVQRHLARQRAQQLVVRLRHVREARPQRVVVRAHERVVAQQIDVVGDEHQVARVPQRVHAAAGVRDDEDARAESPQHAHGERDLLEGVALVAVEPALHRDHAPAGEGPEQELAGVTLDGREGKPRDLLVGDARRDRELAGEAAQAGAEDDRDVGNELRPRPHRAERRVDHVPWWPSSARSSAS